MKIIIKKLLTLTNQEIYDLFKLRQDVFVVEQKCPYHDIDTYDLNAWHVLGYEVEELVACCRILPANTKFNYASIGRVIAKYHQAGLGSQLLDATIDFCKHELNFEIVKVEAQCQALPFYEKKGFKARGEKFLEDNIWHQEMLLDLEKI